MITIKIPAPSSMLIVNLLGVFGLIGLAVAAGGLTGNWWWTLAAVSLEAVFLSVVAARNIGDATEEAPAHNDGDGLAGLRPRAV